MTRRRLRRLSRTLMVAGLLTLGVKAGYDVWVSQTLPVFNGAELVGLLLFGVGSLMPAVIPARKDDADAA